MPILTLPKGSLVTLAGTSLSEHNRSALAVTPDIIKTDVRVANGSLKRYYVASKKKLDLSWANLPALDSQTVDGKAGKNSLYTLYTTNISTTFTVTYKEVNASNVQTSITLTMMIDTYTEKLNKRFDRQFWDCTLTLVEV